MCVHVPKHVCHSMWVGIRRQLTEVAFFFYYTSSGKWTQHRYWKQVPYLLSCLPDSKSGCVLPASPELEWGRVQQKLTHLFGGGNLKIPCGTVRSALNEQKVEQKEERWLLGEEIEQASLTLQMNQAGKEQELLRWVPLKENVTFSPGTTGQVLWRHDSTYRELHLMKPESLWKERT